MADEAWRTKGRPIARPIDFLNAIHEALEMDRPIRSVTIHGAVDAAPRVTVEFFLTKPQLELVNGAIRQWLVDSEGKLPTRDYELVTVEPNSKEDA